MWNWNKENTGVKLKFINNMFWDLKSHGVSCQKKRDTKETPRGAKLVVSKCTNIEEINPRSNEP